MQTKLRTLWQYCCRTSTVLSVVFQNHFGERKNKGCELARFPAQTLQQSINVFTRKNTHVPPPPRSPRRSPPPSTRSASSTWAWPATWRSRSCSWTACRRRSTGRTGAGPVRGSLCSRPSAFAWKTTWRGRPAPPSPLATRRTRGAAGAPCWKKRCRKTMGEGGVGR